MSTASSVTRESVGGAYEEYGRSCLVDVLDRIGVKIVTPANRPLLSAAKIDVCISSRQGFNIVDALKQIYGEAAIDQSGRQEWFKALAAEAPAEHQEHATKFANQKKNKNVCLNQCVANYVEHFQSETDFVGYVNEAFAGFPEAQNAEADEADETVQANDTVQVNQAAQAEDVPHAQVEDVAQPDRYVKTFKLGANLAGYYSDAVVTMIPPTGEPLWKADELERCPAPELYGDTVSNAAKDACRKYLIFEIKAGDDLYYGFLEKMIQLDRKLCIYALRYLLKFGPHLINQELSVHDFKLYLFNCMRKSSDLPGIVWRGQASRNEYSKLIRDCKVVVPFLYEFVKSNHFLALSILMKRKELQQLARDWTGRNFVTSNGADHDTFDFLKAFYRELQEKYMRLQEDYIRLQCKDEVLEKEKTALTKKLKDLVSDAEDAEDADDGGIIGIGSVKPIRPSAPFEDAYMRAAFENRFVFGLVYVFVWFMSFFIWMAERAGLKDGLAVKSSQFKKRK